MLKIPFAVRDNKIVCIADLTDNERGLKCNCKCIACKSPLIAKLGNRKEHHFAHSEKLCDEGQAYIRGMYQLAKEIIDNTKWINLPGIKVAYQYSISPPIDMSNVSDHIRLLPSNAIEEGHIQYISLFNETTIPVTETYIKYKRDKNIEALIIKSETRELAIKIALPSTVCKDYKSKPVKDLSTLEIDLRNDELKLNALTKKEITHLITTNISCKSWISNLKVSRIYSQIIEENDKFIERKKKEKTKKKIEEEAWLKEFEEKAERDRQKLEEQSLQMSLKDRNDFTSDMNQDMLSETVLKKGYEEVSKNFNIDSTEIIKDSFGNRWVYCTLCHKIKHIDQMALYGGDKPNIGKCSECF